MTKPSQRLKHTVLCIFSVSAPHLSLARIAVLGAMSGWLFLRSPLQWHAVPLGTVFPVLLLRALRRTPSKEKRIGDPIQR